MRRRHPTVITGPFYRADAINVHRATAARQPARHWPVWRQLRKWKAPWSDSATVVLLPTGRILLKLGGAQSTQGWFATYADDDVRKINTEK